MAQPMSIRIDDTLKARLDQAAKAEERSLSYIAQKAITSYLDSRDHRQATILKAYQEARTEKAFISGEAMNAWVESWDTDHELPPPLADLHR